MKYDVKTVLIGINRSGSGGIYEADLVMIDSTPYVIIDWDGPRGDSEPHTKVQVDPALLQPAPKGFRADYSYPLPIEDPRKFH